MFFTINVSMPFDFCHHLPGAQLKMSSAEKLYLKSNNFKENIRSSFAQLRDETDFSDVTLVCEGNQIIEAHKVVLAASSPVFKDILKGAKQSNMLIYMIGTNAQNLLSIVDFIYHGEINILQDDLDNFLSLSEELQLKDIVGNNQTIWPHVDSILTKVKHTTKKPLQNENDENYVKIENFEDEVPNELNDTTKSLDQSNASDFDLDLNSKILAMMAKSDRVWICQTCGKTDTNKKNIMNHIEAIHIENQNPCNQCGKLYRSRSLLKAHISYAHTDRT